MVGSLGGRGRRDGNVRCQRSNALEELRRRDCMSFLRLCYGIERDLSGVSFAKGRLQCHRRAFCAQFSWSRQNRDMISQKISLVQELLGEESNQKRFGINM